MTAPLGALPHSGPVIGVGLVVLVLAALVAADRVAVLRVQARIATRLAGRGFAAKPRVRIEGFPFLTQAAARNLRRVVISGPGRKAGPLEIKHIDVTLFGAWVSPGYTSSTADRYHGTALLGFAGIARVAGVPGLTVAGDGPGQLKITASLGPVSGTATARVARAGAGGIRVTLISAGGIPVAMLGSLRDLTLPLPGLPKGTVIHGVSVTGEGVLLHLSGEHMTFG